MFLTLGKKEITMKNYCCVFLIIPDDSDEKRHMKVVTMRKYVRSTINDLIIVLDILVHTIIPDSDNSNISFFKWYFLRIIL